MKKIVISVKVGLEGGNAWVAKQLFTQDDLDDEELIEEVYDFLDEEIDNIRGNE